jgi:lipoprotein-releasing system ATP-binding protein
MANRKAGAAGTEPDASDAPGGARVLVRDLWKVFEHGGRSIEVLRGINLDLAPGALVSVVGASGVGKSTLLHLLGTLDVPTSGQILFDGANVTDMSPAKLASFRNREIGFVFQFHHLLPEFTALENVMMPGLIARRPRKDCRDRAEAILVRVGLQDRLRHRPGELLLGDEPTGNLDTRTGRAIHDLFFELNRELGMTLLLVTHNDELAGRAFRKLRMVDGRIQEEGA